MAVTNMRIMIRRDTADMWLANGDNVLLDGEIGYELDTRRMKIGYQSKAYAELPYFAGGITGIGDDLEVDGNGNIQITGVNTRQVTLVNAEDQNPYATRALALGFSVDPATLQNQEDANLTNLELLYQIDQSLKTETSARQSADSSLQQQIVGIQNDIGTIPGGTSVKEYVDALVQSEAGVRKSADDVLSERITVLKNDFEASVSGIQGSVKSYVDGKVSGETQARMAMDTVLTESKASLSGANFTGKITAPATDNVIPFLYADQAAFPSASTAHGAILHSHADAAMFFAHGGQYHQVLDVNTGYTSGQIDDKFGTLTIGNFSSDNVTDFVGDLLYKNASGDTGGLSIKAYIDQETGYLNDDIDQIYDKDNGTGILADVGAQVNALTVRVTDLETAVGALENKFDVNGDFNGNVIGNTSGVHIGDVQNGAGETVVDAANKKFYGDLNGNVTGETVGSHYGSVYTTDTNTEVINGATGEITGDLTGNADTATTASSVSLNRHVISSIDSNNSDGLVWDAATEATIADGTIVYDQSKGAVYIRIVESGVFDGYAKLSA